MKPSLEIGHKPILGFDVYGGTADSVVGAIKQEITRARADLGQHRQQWLACINPHSYHVAQTDREFASALSSADWLIPDGIGMVWAGRVLGVPVEHRITGSDIFLLLMAACNLSGGVRVFFLGSSDDTLHKISAAVQADFPRVTVAGLYSPPFKSKFDAADNVRMVDAINAAKADILWVAMTAPKQEKWVHRHLNKLDVTFAAAIGAVFDFYVGNVKRSPRWAQRLGLEWLPRLLQQPGRLWRRTFISAPRFIWDTIKFKLRSFRSEDTLSADSRRDS